MCCIEKLRSTGVSHNTFEYNSYRVDMKGWHDGNFSYMTVLSSSMGDQPKWLNSHNINV